MSLYVERKANLMKKEYKLSFERIKEFKVYKEYSREVFLELKEQYLRGDSYLITGISFNICGNLTIDERFKTFKKEIIKIFKENGVEIKEMSFRENERYVYEGVLGVVIYF